MIGLDTNLLLRLWLNDDPAQNRRIDKLLADHGGAPGSLLVTDVVLVEAVWTLRSAYGQGKAGIRIRGPRNDRPGGRDVRAGHLRIFGLSRRGSERAAGQRVHRHFRSSDAQVAGRAGYLTREARRGPRVVGLRFHS